MGKIKAWFFRRFLPEYCRQALVEENTRLKEQLKEKENELKALRSYVEGLLDGTKALRKVVIQNSNVNNEREEKKPRPAGEKGDNRE